MLRQVGWARLQEIREYIAFFRQSGKFSMAFLTTGAEKEYYLASACEVSAAHVCSLLICVWLLCGRQLLLAAHLSSTHALRAQEVYVPPTGNLSLRGLVVAGNREMLCSTLCQRDVSCCDALCIQASEWRAHAGSFLRGVLEKAGVEPQVKRIGKYKSAGMPRPAPGCCGVMARLGVCAIGQVKWKASNTMRRCRGPAAAARHERAAARAAERAAGHHLPGLHLRCGCQPGQARG